jgi:hypothetical protein
MVGSEGDVILREDFGHVFFPIIKILCFFRLLQDRPYCTMRCDE